MSEVKHFYFSCSKCYNSTSVFFSGYVQPVFTDLPKCSRCLSRLQRYKKSDETKEDLLEKTPSMEIREARNATAQTGSEPIPERYLKAFDMPEKKGDKK